MLSDSEHKKTKKSGRDRAIQAQGNKQWSDKQKREAATTYLALGNMSMVSQLLGIPYITLKVWKKSEWWGELLHELKTQEKLELSARMKKIINASLTVVEDRLVNGDFQFDQKSGQNVRKPVNLRDAHKVAVDLQQRQEILEKVDKEVVSDESVENKLLTLAEKFAEMATKKIEQKQLADRTIEVMDVEVKE